MGASVTVALQTLDLPVKVRILGPQLFGPPRDVLALRSAESLPIRIPRLKRHVHGLDADGMVVCNPRDREASHRAQVGDIATGDVSTVTCGTCRRLMRRARRENAFTPPTAPGPASP